MANQFRGCYRLAHKLVSLRLVRWRLGTNGKNTKPRGGFSQNWVCVILIMI